MNYSVTQSCLNLFILLSSQNSAFSFSILISRFFHIAKKSTGLIKRLITRDKIMLQNNK